MTLPLRTLETLSTIDTDRARAIVRVTDAVTNALPAANAVEVVTIDEDSAVVIVGPCPSLADIPWLRTVEIAPKRHLISLVPGTSVDSLEVAIVDLLDARRTPAPERSLLEQLLTIIRRRRRDRTISKGEILFVPPEPVRRPR